MNKINLLFFSQKNNIIKDHSLSLCNTYHLNYKLQQYHLLPSLVVYTDIHPKNIIKFWYLFLLHKRVPYLAWPEELHRISNLKTNTKNLFVSFTQKTKIINQLNYVKSEIMPFVDEDYQSISSLTQSKQTLKLGSCTTTNELYPLVLKTNITIDNIKLIYNFQIIENTSNMRSTLFLLEMFKFPIDMLLRSQKN